MPQIFHFSNLRPHIRFHTSHIRFHTSHTSDLTPHITPYLTFHTSHTLTVLTLLVRLRHEVLTGAHPGPELVLRADAAAVVAHPLHPVLSERQDEVRRRAGRQTTVHISVKSV